MSSDHIHTPGDGRGNREVLLNGKLLHCVTFADTKNGIVRVVPQPPVIDRERGEIIEKTLRGEVEVRPMG